MKKIYFISALIGIGSTAIAQAPQRVEIKNSDRQVYKKAQALNEMTVKPNVIDVNKAAGDTVWIDYFNDPTLWDGNIDPMPGAPVDSIMSGWSIGDTLNGAFSGNGNDMNTQGSFARFANEDLVEAVFTMNYTGSIDLTGIPAPHLEFEQAGAKFIENQEIRISVDGGSTWVTVADNSDKEPLTLAGGSQYPRPETRRFNMTSALGAGPYNDVRIQFYWSGAQNGPSMNYSAYGWFIDNLRIVEGYGNDMTVQNTNMYNGSQLIPYYFTPVTQITSMVFAADAKNNGGSDQTNVALSVTLDDGTNVNTVTSSGVNVTAGSTADSLVTGAFTPAANIATYNVEYEITQDEIEGFPSDNSFTESLYITDTVYGVDNDNQTGGFSNFGSNSGQPVKVGNQMEIIADGQISSISVLVSDIDASIGQSISGQLHILDQTQSPAQFSYQEETNFHQITAADLGEFVTLVFADPVQVSAGDIILPLASHDGLDVSFGAAQKVQQGIVLGQVSNGDYVSLIDPNAIMLRVNMNPFASVDSEEISSVKLNQYPNPFSVSTNVDYSIEKSASVSYKVVDMTGKVLSSNDEGVKSAGQHTFVIDGSSFASGIYYLKLNVDGDTVIRKMVVSK